MTDDVSAAPLSASNSALHVPPFHAMAMAAKASALEATGRQIWHLEVGQPGTGAPLGARRAAIEALEHGASLGYTNARGIPALLDRIAQHYAESYGCAVDPRRIAVVSGASAGFTLAFLAAFDRGQRVGILEPGYPAYRNTLTALGLEPVAIPVSESSNWAPTMERLDAAGPLDGLIIASPSNPTGTVLDDATLRGISAYCTRHGIQLIADEIYHGITYESAAPSLVGINPDAVVINSFSKYFSMTGWRLGWMVLPDHLLTAVERLQQNLYICAPHVSQVAGLAAFDCRDELGAHVVRYREHRDLLIDGLASAGITQLARPDGAFYLYANVAHLTDDSLALCDLWLEQLGLAATPGLDFDLQQGSHFVRFSYAGRREHVMKAGELLAGWRP